MNKFTLIDRAFYLKRTPLFGMLDLDLLLAIADKLQIITFDEGQPIFGLNEDAYRMYFLVKGQVDIRDAEGKILSTLVAEDFFGDEALFNEKPRAYEAICKSKSVLLALSQTNLLTIISECPAVAVGLLQAYSSISPFRHRSHEKQ